MRNTLLCLILFFWIGIALTGCMRCNCPPVEGSYFDIQGIERINHMEQVAEYGYAPIPEGGKISFEKYRGLDIDFSVSYLSQENKKINGKKVLYACDCLANGTAGAKNEKIKQITVVTLYDFNSAYLAKDTINALISVGGKPLDEYLAVNDDLIEFPVFNMSLIEAPALDNRFKVKVILQLNTGETYEAESSTLILTQ